mmetsp:Transcript_10575/g.30943  ORF Transcript_10575/g.30943 Transcript_10575/m.30943 type:complete len:260 (-) Transcript_10575:1579-2358(-)
MRSQSHAPELSPLLGPFEPVPLRIQQQQATNKRVHSGEFGSDSIVSISIASLLLLLVKCNVYSRHSSFVFLDFNLGTPQHGTTGTTSVRIVVFVLEIDNLLDARLDDLFGAVLARKQCHVEGTAVHVRTVTPLAVENGVDLGVRDVHVLVVDLVVVQFSPRHVVVVQSARHAVVSQPNDPALIVDDAGSDLRAGVLRPLGRQECHAHEIVLPRQVVFAPAIVAVTNRQSVVAGFFLQDGGGFDFLRGRNGMVVAIGAEE